MAKISKNIKKLRQERGLTQEAFAEKLHLTRQAVSSWETGRTQPDVEMLGVISKEFCVSVEELIYGEKRNTSIDNNGKNYFSTATVIISLLGALFVTAGLVLIFIWSWKKIPMFFKGAFSFLPLLASQAFAGYVFFKKKKSIAFSEGAGLTWALGVIATVSLANGIFGLEMGYMNCLLIDAFMILPIMYLMKAVAPLTVYLYMVLHRTIYFADMLPYNPSFSEVLGVFSLSLFLFSAAILFAFRYKEKLGEIRFSYTKWICSVSAIIYTVFAGFILDLNLAVPLLTVFTVLFVLSAKDGAFSPLVILGYIGTALSGLVSVYLESSSFHLAEPSVILGTVISTGVIASAVYMRRDAFRNNIIKLLQLIILSLLMLYSLLFYYYKPLGFEVKELDALMEFIKPVAIILLFALSVLFILEGVKENRLFFINVGFISLCANLFMLLTGLDVNLLIKGGTLLIMGIALLLINLKITNKKKNGKVTVNEEE